MPLKAAAMLFDANAFIGSDPAGGYPAAGKDDLVEVSSAAGIERALVWHILQFCGSPAEGNAAIDDAVAGDDRLLGCWAILPPQTGEVPVEGILDRMRAHRIAALRAFPGKHHFLLRRRVFGGFLDEVARRRVPVLLSLDHGITWPEVYDFLEDCPEVTCVLCDIGLWGQDRFTWPLLEGFPNVYVETSYLSLEAGGIEAAVERYGARRLVFGSAFPKRYPQASVLDLLHAPISQADREMIASGNLRALVEGAEL